MFLAPVLSAQLTTAPTGRPTVTLKLAPTAAADRLGYYGVLDGGRDDRERIPFLLIFLGWGWQGQKAALVTQERYNKN